MAGKWWNPFSWGEKDPSIVTKTVTDPMKVGVATPLSEYLRTEIGKGLPSAVPRDVDVYGPEAETRYTEFLGMKPEEFFEEKVAGPTMRRWREDVLPIVREGYAGALRGSGRFRSEEESAMAVSERLGEVGGLLVPQLYEQQQRMAQARYRDWLKSTPQYNPALQQAIAFLSEGTSTGKTVLSGLDPGRKGWFADLIAISMEAAGTLAQMAA